MADAKQEGQHPQAVLTPEDAGSARLALARIAFLTEGAPSPDVVREPILASWTRSRLWHVPVDHLDVPFEADLDGESALLRAARPVLAEAAEQFASEPVSVILCDANGVVLTRDTGDAAPGEEPGPGLARPRLQLRGGARRHQRHRHRAGGRRAGQGLRPRALRGAPGGVRLYRGAGAAPGHAQGARRHRPDVLAPRRRLHDGRRRVGVGPAHRGDAAGALRAPRARAAARLPDRLPAQPRRRAGRGRRPADAQRPGARPARPRRPGTAARGDRRGAGHRAPPAATGGPAQRADRPRPVQAELQRGQPRQASPSCR